MPNPSDLEAEIAALKAGLTPPREAPAQAAPAAEQSTVEAEVAGVLRELQRHLAETVPAAEEEIAAHPLAAVATAFLLGLVVGRLWRGR